MNDYIGYPLKLAVITAACALVLGIFRAYWKHIGRPRWHLRNLPQLPFTSGFSGKLTTHEDFLVYDLRTALASGTGTLVRQGTWLRPPILVTTDKSALSKVLVSHPLDFPKPLTRWASLRNALSQGGYIRQWLHRQIFKPDASGLLFSEGEAWHRQRKIMNTSFGVLHVRSMFPIFMNKAQRFRDVLLNEVSRRKSPAAINIHEHMEHISLDILSAAGFGYETDAIEGASQNPLRQAFIGAFTMPQPSVFMALLHKYIPPIRFIPDNSAGAVRARNGFSTLYRIGKELVDEKKEAVIKDSSGGGKPVVTLSQMEGRDILSALLRSNMAPDLKPHQIMSDDEVLAQIVTLFVASRGVTANAMTWAIFGLCEHPEFQTRLREEISPFTGMPSYDELNSLPFLDAVVRETLRMYPPFPAVVRVASKDTVLPLSSEAPITDAKGAKRDSIFVAKGTLIYVPILFMNRSPALWGPDAGKFDPSRWTDRKLPNGVTEMPSLSFPSFLAGPRSCIGYRFAFIEMKAVLFSLVKAFKLELAVPPSDIECHARSLTRPLLKTRRKRVSTLPVKLTPVVATC